MGAAPQRLRVVTVRFLNLESGGMKMDTKRMLAALVAATGIGTASACPLGVVPQAHCVTNSAAVVVAEPVVVTSVVPLAAQQIVVQSPVVASSVVVATPVTTVAVAPTVVRQRVVVRNFGTLRTRVRW